MQSGLTSYLFRTFVPKPVGLNVKLKIVRVKSELVTFNEAVHPAATIMSHGLFLALPTPPEDKDPLVLGVLNQQELRDQEPETKFGVCFGAGGRFACDGTEFDGCSDRFEKYLGKRKLKGEECGGLENQLVWRRNLSLIRNGIVKQLPDPTHFDSTTAELSESRAETLDLQRLDSQTIPDPSIPEKGCESLEEGHCFQHTQVHALAPSELFICIIRNLLLTYQDGSTPPKQALAISSEAPLPDNHSEAGIKSPSKLQWKPDYQMEAIGGLLASFYTTLRHLKRFIPPKHPLDQELYESVTKRTQHQLHSLAHLMLTVFLQPFCDTLAKVSMGGQMDGTNFLPEDCKGFSALTNLMQRLMGIGNRPFSDIPHEEFAQQLPYCAGLCDRKFLNSISSCLLVREFRQRFLPQLQILSDAYLPDSELAQKTAKHLNYYSLPRDSEVRQLMRHYITSEYSHLGDRFLKTLSDHKFCSLKTARSDNCEGFSPTLDTANPWKLVAVIVSLDIRVFILSEKLDLDELSSHDHAWETAPDAITHIKVFRQEIEIESFCIKASLVMGKDLCNGQPTPYFTGRYYIKWMPHYCGPASEIFVLDLAPCFRDPPQIPLHYKERMSTFTASNSLKPIDYACTDRFISYLSASTQDLVVKDNYDFKPLELALIKFETPQGLTKLEPLPCDHLFDEIMKDLGNPELFGSCHSVFQISWSKDTSKLYFTNWNYFGLPKSSKSLLICCFEVSASLDCMKTLAFSHFQLKHLSIQELFHGRSPRFATLQVRKKDYLVMEIMEKPERRAEDILDSEVVLARALFAVHKNKLHWVPVNGQQIVLMPRTLGTPVRYPGYATKHTSLFHHCRVFCKDKVVSNLYRLDYKPR